MKIVLIGKAGSGKDTVADYLVYKYGFKKYAFADKIKQIVKDLFPEELKSDRRSILQNVGDSMRQYNSYCWINYLLKVVKQDDFCGMVNPVITDCRSSNEYDSCVKEGFAPVSIECSDRIRVARLFSRDKKVMTVEQINHASEQFTDCLSYRLDNNDNFDHLYYQIDELINELNNGG